MTTYIQSTRFLGEVRGRANNGVAQFLGIKYATLKDRFADAELVQRHGEDVLDGTKDGPTTISPLFGCDLEFSAIQHTLPKKDLLQSEVDCLNLNITIPDTTTVDSKLPVFAFIHGGGFFIGANSWPQFDYERFVKLSVDNRLPIVAVSINYRLGPFGFLTSDELRKAGYKANNGLRDQRVALEWVRMHISDFGGDPDNITVAGMSAGGASITYHLDSESPLFRQAILMSGTRFFSHALSYDEHESNYHQAILELGLENATPEERVKTLLGMPGQDLLAKLPPTIKTAPAIDGDIVLSTLTHAQVADRTSDFPRGKNWCQRLLVGDAQLDKSILVGYGFTAEAADEVAFSAILDYLTDVFALAPVLTYAQGWKGRAHVYYFNEGNPWDGPFKGRASHILDLAYLFQNFREFLTPDQEMVGATFAVDFFKFCHGIEPWPAVLGGDIQKGFTARTYGPSSQGSVAGLVPQAYGGESQRRSTLFDLSDKVSLDELASVGTLFLTM
ncbi:carboxylesterase [Aspergillus ellipticus CBS 707.79]|uniref:Carboxylic ester hydrolase n=1 Tax=Aspergillus ellipticus CBS 707.79 TaxID=1448320 RepID=A0A319DGP4_9EURO|nr:carboxylesterase [Aspergillus ellipticus CBS 707.79]